MIEPHGGYLVHRMVDRSRYGESIGVGAEAPHIYLDDDAFNDALNIASGTFSPLTGFMTRDDLLKVARDMTLEDGTVWPLPITLDVENDVTSQLKPGERAILHGPDGNVMGFLDIEDIYRYNATEIAEHVFGTVDTDHPGVRYFLNQSEFFVGGDVTVFDDYRYNSYDLRPAESRVLFREYGWNTVVGFQTRNVPHRGHEYIQKCALELVDGVLVQPKLGKKKPGDYRDEVILDSYRQLVEHYYRDDRVALSVFPSRMRYAGPREAVFDAIVRKNQGCTHFIIGRDHAGVADYYDAGQSRRIFSAIDDIGIEPLLFEHAFYCRACDGMCSDKVCPHADDQRVYPSGTEIRAIVQSGKRPSPKVMRPEIASYITDVESPFVEG